MGTLEAQQMTGTKLNRIAWLSKQDSGKEFECLMHLINMESLTECFHRLDKHKAVGIDGIDKTSYGRKLKENILANIFAHHVIDVWIQEVVQPRCRGRVQLFRYADDAVLCCQYAEDAQRIRLALQKRLARFELQLNEEKTKLVSFDKRLAARGIEQGTFDFLGFTFYLGKSRRGRIIPKLRTRAKTIRTKLERVTNWIKDIRNRQPMKEIWRIFKAKLRGHIQYYGVSHNQKGVNNFLYQAIRIVFKWINRRSQRKSFSWERFNAFMAKDPLPRAIIAQPLF